MFEILEKLTIVSSVESFANSLDQSVKPDLDSNCLTL